MNTAAAGQGGAFVSAAPGGSAITGLPLGYFFSLQPFRVSSSVIRLGGGVAKDNLGAVDIGHFGISNIDITVTGANGRNVDTVEQASRWYSINVIWGSAVPVAGFFINENDLATFTYPAGYTARRRVGWIRNDASSNFAKGEWKGLGNWREFYYDCEIAACLALSGGSAIVFTPVDLSVWVPPSTDGPPFSGPRFAFLAVRYDAVGMGNTAYLRKNGSTVVQPTFNIKSSVGWNAVLGGIVTDGEDLGTRQIDYKVATVAENMDIMMRGYTDYMG